MKISAFTSLDYEQWNHKPSSKLQYKDQMDKFGNPRSETKVIGARLGGVIEQVTPKSLARAISRGQTWSPFIFNICPQWKRPRRVEGLFKSCQVLALDFDNGESAEEIAEQAKNLNLEFNIIHHSFSSTSEHLKLRGVIFLGEEVTEFEKARLYSVALANAFPGADKQCIDVARLYFGSKIDSVIHVNSDVYAKLSVIEEIAKSTNAENFLVKSERNLMKSDDSEWGDSKTQRLILSKLSVKKRKYVTRKALGILSDIETFDGAKGSRYECVWKNASRLARMPELTGSAVYQWTLEAIQKNPIFANWDWDAEAVVMSAIEWSSSHADEPV